VYGTQTAIVVGVAGQPVTTDRDHRIKLQFAWARGDASASRLDHPGGKNAPADETAGTWVRMAETLAGANWGGSFVPRSGQEVLVTFLEGDIDRPVIIGAVYNGQGSQNAQTNSVG
jgi:type VI secretion system secreted protein VgrG